MGLQMSYEAANTLAELHMKIVEELLEMRWDAVQLVR
jgi:hypothetical protein